MVDRSSSGIHPTAVIYPGARLGENVEIGPYVVIEEDVFIGDHSTIGAHTVIKRHTRMGRENRVSEHVVIGGEPQDYKFDGSRSYVSIGDGNLIREGVTIHRGSTPEAHTTIGDNCFLMVASHVAHDCQIGNRVVLTNSALLAGFVSIADGAIISGNVVIHQYCRVGRLAFAGGGARVSQDCLPFMITEGSPARARALNAVGLRRAGFPPEEITSLKRAFHVLRTSTRLDDALNALGGDTSAAVTELVQFIRDSKRGFSHPTR
jgi:UDP-N-acetylglucosamine acyltransferase